MLRAALLLSLASNTAATSCCVCNSYPSCRSYSYSNASTARCVDAPPSPKEDRLRLEFKASDRHSRGELHSSQI